MTELTQEPPTPLTRRPRLTTLRGVRRELSVLYTELRTGVVNAGVAGRAAFILNSITKVLEVELLERRIDALERRADSLPGQHSRQASWAGHA
jgi:hypothetical protein